MDKFKITLSEVAANSGLVGEDKAEKKAEKARLALCKIAHGEDQGGAECGVLVYDPKVDDHELSKHCIITVNEVVNLIENKNFEKGKYEVTFRHKNKQFDLQDVTKVVRNASGLVLIFINSSCKGLKKCSILSESCLSIAVPDHSLKSSLFCFIENQRYNVVESTGANGEEGVYVLEPDSKTARSACDSPKEIPHGTVLLQYDADDKNVMAVGIFKVVNKEHLKISPIWFKSSLKDLLAETPAPPKEPEIPANFEPDGPSPPPAGSVTANAETPAPPKEPEIPANFEPDGPSPPPAGSVTANVSKQLVSEAVTENTLLLEKLSKMLDREIRIIRCWKHLADVLEVPDKIRKRCNMYTEHSPTEDLLYHVTNKNPYLTVQQLKKKLETIFRNDVIEDLNKGGYKDETSVVELFAKDPKFNNILSRLDEKTMHNYKDLAKEFKINILKIDQLGMRGSGGPTAFLFYYMSFTEGLKDLTMGQLCKLFEEMELIKLAKVVTKATNEDSDLVKDVVVEGSDVLEEIADNLNHKKQILKNWRHLANKLGIVREVYESFDTSKEDSHSPTKMMFEWLQQSKPNLTVENLLDGLKQIERLDVKQEVIFALKKKKKQKSKNDSTQVYDTEKQAVHNLWRMSHDTDQAKKEKHDLSAGLREKAATQGLRIVDNDGKGNCMFSALCHQLEIKKGLTYLHVDLRTELVQYLRNHPDLNDFVDQEEYPTWDYYVDEMAKIGRWGDGVILLAAARHLQCVIRVISNRPDFPDVFLRPDGKELVELVLGHIFQYHFVSLEPEH